MHDALHSLPLPLGEVSERSEDGEGISRCSTLSYYFSIKWLTPFYPANPSQAAGGGEKCMDLRFLRLRRWLLKQQPNKTVFNRFIEN